MKFTQVIAATLKNFLTLDYGLSIAIISIIIPALREPNRGLNINETLYITPSEASWLGLYERIKKYFEINYK